jgi:tRNA(fMet)-specific endonuclease VapC
MIALAYLFDSDTLTHYSHGHPGVVARMETHAEGEIGLTAISIEESLTGWQARLRKCKHPEQFEHVYQNLIDSVTTAADFRSVNFSMEAFVRFNELKKLKLNVGKNDLRIAAIALEHNATVVSANLRDFTRVPGLKVEDWTQ